MLIFVVALAAAWGVRALWPDRPRATIRVRWVWMPVVAALCQVVLGLDGRGGTIDAGRFALLVASYALVGAWLIANAWYQAPPLRVPAALIAGGWALNVIPILANRGMPVSAAALARIGNHHPDLGHGNLGKHVLATSHTILPWLGDVVAVPVPLLRNVISVGDIVMVIGAVLAVQFVQVGSRTEPSGQPAPALAPAATHAADAGPTAETQEVRDLVVRGSMTT
jgi:Family of unknown function (DUF5317)